MDDARLLTVEQVADRLGVSKHQVYRRISRGDLKAVQRPGRSFAYGIPESEVEEYLSGGQPLSNPTRARDMMRVPEVAQALGFTVETVRRMCNEGRLPSIRGVGSRGHFRIPRQAVEDYLSGVK